jgi:hypothetical protein
VKISREQININNNNSEDYSFLVRAAFQTLDDGHFRLKHIVKDLLNPYFF